MTTTILNTNNREVENEISNVTGLVKKTDYNAKISDIEGKYFTTFDYEWNTWSKDGRKELPNKSNIINLVKKI